jgi:hypothetical protein
MILVTAATGTCLRLDHKRIVGTIGFEPSTPSLGQQEAER